MNSPARDIVDYIVAQSLGTLGAASGWGVYLAKEPTAPNTTITVYDTGGFNPDIETGGYRPTVQVRVRAHDYVTAYAKAAAIQAALLAPKGFTQGGTHYVGVWQEGDITTLGYDENDRILLVANYSIYREA